MRVPALSALVVAGTLLSSCQSAGGRVYDLGEGDANYDALAKATRECQAQGGKVEAKPGYDERLLSTYQCRLGAK